MPEDDDLNLAKMVQEAGVEYAAALDAMHGALRAVVIPVASLDDAAGLVAELARRGWQLTKLED